MYPSLLVHINEYQQKEEKCSNWKRYQNSEEKWRNNHKILIQVISHMEKSVLTALIGKVELGKDPKKNLSVSEILLSIPFLFCVQLWPQLSVD